MKSFLFTLSGLLIALAHVAHSDTLHFREQGYSIDALIGVSTDETFQSMSMFLPVTDGFAPNVNVQIQSFVGDVDDYERISLKQIKQMGMSLRQEVNKSGDELVFFYEGTANGRDLRFYSKAIRKNGSYYLATATALQSQWPIVGKRLMDSVGSFSLDD
ncbi:MAG: hypothetical protein AAGJ81_05655 [Verrucomicrobiota bacterium]